MSRQSRLIFVLIASFLPWPASQQLFSLIFTASTICQSNERLLKFDSANNMASLDPYVDLSNDEIAILCEYEQELNEEESVDGSAENDWGSSWVDWGLGFTIVSHESCMRQISDSYRLSYPMIKSRIVCRC